MAQSQSTMSVFCSYAHADEKLKDQLRTFLKPLEKQGLIEFWHDRLIRPGTEWAKEIDSNLIKADLILLLISSDFLASDYCTGIELELAMKRHREDACVVVPIIVRPCDWNSSAFAQIQSLPKNATPIMSWPDRDEALTDVTRGIRSVVETWITPPADSKPTEISKADPRIAFKDIDVGVEKELKFAGVANLQMKFLSVESSSVILEKLATVCRMLELDMGRQAEMQISDEYYDDPTMYLSESGCSLRRRTENKRHLVTFKRDFESGDGFGLQRFEKELSCEDSEFRELVNSLTSFKVKFGSLMAGMQRLPAMPLQRILTICNRRTTMPIKTKAASYKFCYDRFYFFDEMEGVHSEYFTEIEIELSDSEPKSDEQMEKLVDGIGNFFQHKQHKNSKLRTGLDWLKRPQAGVNDMYAAAMQILKFAEMPRDSQQQALQALNRFAKDILREQYGDDKLPACITAGDGIVLLFTDHPGSIVDLVAKLQRSIREIHNRQSYGSRFSFRTGLHAGNVFKFTDLDENLNFAGDAIYLSRDVMVLGREWHVLATRAAYEAMISNSTENPGHKSRKLRTMNGSVVDIFNIHEHDEKSGRSFGNPVDPLSM